MTRRQLLAALPAAATGAFAPRAAKSAPLLKSEPRFPTRPSSSWTKTARPASTLR